MLQEIPFEQYFEEREKEKNLKRPKWLLGVSLNIQCGREEDRRALPKVQSEMLVLLQNVRPQIKAN